jgi:hypothetical protein
MINSTSLNEAHYALLQKNNADTLEQVYSGIWVSVPVQDVVNDTPAIGRQLRIFRVHLFEQVDPFLTELKHHGSVSRWLVCCPKRHDREALLVAIWGKECGLFLVRVVNCDLVIFLPEV